MFIYQKREEKIDRDWAGEKWVHIVKQQKEGKKNGTTSTFADAKIWIDIRLVIFSARQHKKRVGIRFSSHISSIEGLKRVAWISSFSLGFLLAGCCCCVKGSTTSSWTRKSGRAKALNYFLNCSALFYLCSIVWKDFNWENLSLSLLLNESSFRSWKFSSSFSIYRRRISYNSEELNNPCFDTTQQHTTMVWENLFPSSARIIE